MDFGMDNVGDIIASSTTSYLSEFAPVILLVAGIALAFGVLDRLLERFFPTNIDRRDD